MQLRYRGRVATPCDTVTEGDHCVWKVNTPFVQDGPALCVPIGAPGVVFRVSDCCVGFGTTCPAQRSGEDVGITGDERHRVYSYSVFTFCVVCRNASNSSRIGGGN